MGTTNILFLNKGDTKAENEIIELSKKDAIHFRPIYEKYFKNIFLFVYNKIGDKEITSDIVSQVFVKALSNLHKYEYRGLPFSSWLYKIASTETMQHFRNNKKVRWVSISDEMIDNICEEAKGPDSEELKSGIENIIKELDLLEVQILELRYYENKSYKEIAFITEMSETNVKTKAWRIIEKIRNKLKS